MVSVPRATQLALRVRFTRGMVPASVDIELPITIRRQPDYTTCGPTSLHAVYRYFGDTITLEQVIDEVRKLEGGGTMRLHLAVHALRRGYQAETWICNVAWFDPTWFQQKTDVIAKLKARMAAKECSAPSDGTTRHRRSRSTSGSSGKLRWGDLTPRLIGARSEARPADPHRHERHIPLSVHARDGAGPDDVAGDPFGHFVVVCGYHSSESSVSIADPLMDNPLHGAQYYRASVHRLIGSIFLGTGSNDSNFLVIKPKGWKGIPQ